MDIAEEIYKEVSRLPEHLALEVLDFLKYIERKHNLQDKSTQDLKAAQSSVMNDVWSNEADEIWNGY